MPHARPASSRTHRERDRRAIAALAARLMAEGGRDLATARRKAAAKLQVADESAWPANDEVEAALREHQRLFMAGVQPRALLRRREAALEAMAFFQAFDPRICGPVLDGSADQHSPVELHLHAEPPEAIALFLHEQRIPADEGQRSLRLGGGRTLKAPCWRFSADGLAFDLVVLPPDALRQPPLGEDGHPLPRATAAALRSRMAAGG